jgi:hypothetical protein
MKSFDKSDVYIFFFIYLPVAYIFVKIMERLF